MKNILITGGCGFIGHHIVEHILKNTDWNIKIIDSLNYASTGFNRLRDIKVFDFKRVFVFTNNLENKVNDYVIKEIGDINYILHLSAETHVDNSIREPLKFIKSNIIGTYNLLEYAKKIHNLEMLVYFSTDEVFGTAPEKKYFKEWDRYNSRNPYSATKAGAEELCLAYANTYKLPIIITHTMNCFGERQHPEKFIPSTIRKILEKERVIIHSNPEKTKAGVRSYIHCRNVADALLFLLNYKDRDKILYDYPDGIKSAGKFNIVGEKEIDNLTLAKFISKIMKKDLIYEMVDFHSSRPGHDLRYALNGEKMSSLGWKPRKNFYETLIKTVNWYFTDKNLKWLYI